VADYQGPLYAPHPDLVAHYTVRYKTESNGSDDFCCYAQSAYDARIAAMELNPWIHSHPNAITHIIKEEDFQW